MIVQLSFNYLTCLRLNPLDEAVAIRPQGTPHVLATKSQVLATSSPARLATGTL